MFWFLARQGFSVAPNEVDVSDSAEPASASNESAHSDFNVDATASSLDAAQTSSLELGSIGPYRLVCKLGEGGMGSVWLGEQTYPVKRRVAIKVVKAGLFSEPALRRFDVERQSLAIMNHPAIAKVYEAGSTPSGEPYFVMEYVDGAPITNYCNQKCLGLRQRIELMIKVCDGVQHAHQNAIMHRDLKPSNILVTQIDGQAVPRIIDFGIAKSMQPTAQEDETINPFTQMGNILGTPGYISPEQANPGILNVDTRTDVYSLGVVLYELLTASLPFDPKLWKTKPLHEVLRQLQEEDPPSPSTRITASSAQATNSGMLHHKLANQIRGDLDWITLKAVERDRDRRYHSASEFSADLTRFLRNEPITARPPSIAYRASKFVRRNRLAVAFTLVLAVVVIAAGITLIEERNRARREAEISRRVADFMSNMFKVSDPSESRGNAVTAREILDKASAEIESGLAQDPKLQARLMFEMGKTYRGLGIDLSARRLISHALDIQSRVLGSDDPDTLQSMALLGVIERSLGHRDESEKLLRKALDGQRRALGPEHAETMSTANFLTETLSDEGHHSEAEQLLRRTLAIQQRTLGPENPATLRSMRSLASNLENQGRHAEAEKIGRETLAVEQRVLGADHPGTLWSINMLALALQGQGQYGEAEKLYREAYEGDKRVLGPDHPNTLAAYDNIGLTLQAEGRLAEAEQIQRESVEHTRRIMGGDTPDTTIGMSNLGITLGQERKLEESEKVLRQALAIEAKARGEQSPQWRTIMGNLGSTLAYANRANETIAAFDKLITNASNAEGADLASAHFQYGAALAVLGRSDEAFVHLQTAADLGFMDAEQLRTTPDLKPLRGDPRFQAVLDQLQKNQRAVTR
jgi:non-specific serine/threonine protein kinase/serine/threonine-protein kinase